MHIYTCGNSPGPVQSRVQSVGFDFLAVRRRSEIRPSVNLPLGFIVAFAQTRKKEGERRKEKEGSGADSVTIRSPEEKEGSERREGKERIRLELKRWIDEMNFFNNYG